MENGRAARLLHSTWGALLVIAAAAMVGSGGTLLFTGLFGVPDRQTAAEARITTLERTVEDMQEKARADSTAFANILAEAKKITDWVICTTVPPNRSDVLLALRVECSSGYRGEGRYSVPDEDDIDRGVESVP